MNSKLDFLIFIARFQPFHIEHEQVIRKALQLSERVIIVSGSSFLPRNPLNPFTHYEIKDMIYSCFPEAAHRLLFIPMADSPYNDEGWNWMLQKTVYDLFKNDQNDIKDPTIGIITTQNDSAWNYKGNFPQWIPTPINVTQNIDMAHVCHLFFQQDQQLNYIAPLVPDTVLKFLRTFSATADFKTIFEEKNFIDTYKKGWESAIYPPTFVTVDAVVCQSGHILLVKRKAYPGKNLLALPGGFVGQSETLFEACIRELRSETRLKVPEPVIKGSLKSSKVFDYPYRSLRGRTITHAYYFELSQNHHLPEVKGGQDAKQAFWLPLGNLDSSHLFEDHYYIIQDMLRMYMT